MRDLMLRALTAALVLSAVVFARPTIARADDMSCPPPLPVTIDIKPGNAQNTVKLSSRGTLVVAVLTAPGFDASQFTPEMAHLNDSAAPMAEDCTGASAVRWTLEDENNDGKPDLVFFFHIQDLGFTVSTTSATLMAHGSYAGTATHIEGADMVHPVP